LKDRLLENPFFGRRAQLLQTLPTARLRIQRKFSPDL
jgi:hypothetical protein